jgi:hypothetical protein
MSRMVFLKCIWTYASIHTLSIYSKNKVHISNHARKKKKGGPQRKGENYVDQQRGTN